MKNYYIIPTAIIPGYTKKSNEIRYLNKYLFEPFKSKVRVDAMVNRQIVGRNNVWKYCAHKKWHMRKTIQTWYVWIFFYSELQINKKQKNRRKKRNGEINWIIFISSQQWKYFEPVAICIFEICLVESFNSILVILKLHELCY